MIGVAVFARPHSAKSSPEVTTFHKNYAPFRLQGGTMRKKAGTFRVQAGTMRKKSGMFRVQDGMMRKKGGTFRVQGGTMRKKGGTFRVQGGTMRKKGGTFRVQGGTMRKKSGTFRVQGGTMRKKDETIRDVRRRVGARYASGGEAFGDVCAVIRSCVSCTCCRRHSASSISMHLPMEPRPQRLPVIKIAPARSPPVNRHTIARRL
jgi:hypothetical protein